MKKMKFITMAVLGLSLLGFSSCNDDDDNNYLTSADKTTCYMQVQGNHDGSVIYVTGSSSSTTTTDTTTCSFNITRTFQDDDYVYKMYIYDLPIKALAYNMNDGDCKTAMEEAENITLECTIDFYNMSPVSWLINPVTPEFTLEYGGATHKIQVPFILYSYYSIGAYGTVSNSSSPDVKQIRMQILAAAIYVDGQETSLLKSYTNFYFMGNVD